MERTTPSKLSRLRSDSSLAATPPPTPGFTGPRRSSRSSRLLTSPGPAKPDDDNSSSLPTPIPSPTKAKRRLSLESPTTDPVTPIRSESKRPKRTTVQYKKVLHGDVQFQVGDDIYVKKQGSVESDSEDPDVEECRVCFTPSSKSKVMIECDDCLGGFHLRCLKPPLKKIPEGDWICSFCTDRKDGKEVVWPEPPEGKKIKRTAREKLLSGDLHAACIKSIWRKVDGSYWLRCIWYRTPEETAAGRQPHNLRRELYRTNDYGDVQINSVLRHCYVMNPEEYQRAGDEGDDIFYCEYEYDVNYHNFKRLPDIEDGTCDADYAENDESSDYEGDSDGDSDNDDKSLRGTSSTRSRSKVLAANSRKGRAYWLPKIAESKTQENRKRRKQTNLEKASAALSLTSRPTSPPCRNKEMEEIETFVKGAIGGHQCLGRCLYIHGVPGTGKTMSVRAVMRNLKSEVDSGVLRPFCFIETNGMKLSSPNNIYKNIYEQLSGHAVGWKKALHCLNEHFSNGKKLGKKDQKPIVLLIDELDMLVTRNQSVLYNILDWPTRPNSKLIVIGIANTMDLPEHLSPRISSRMGIQRLCFLPYNHEQLAQIILSRLKGIDAFEDNLIELACRKVAASSGDARRALQICQRAAVLAEYRVKQSADAKAKVGKSRVCLTDIEGALDEVFKSPHIQRMKMCSKFGKIVLTAMVNELHRTGGEELTFEKLSERVISFCSMHHEAFPGFDTLMRACCLLGDSGIILCEEPKKHMSQKLQLNCSSGSDDVALALKDCSEIPWLSLYL
ncbi:Origin recognition complex subunit 1 [Rhynchospora pubera]|uniref:Origin recognition complex subunit 1 n=1 Tax=Rhynchospora pubera TaxID=906938 RepID=A0AAV8D7H2_9POAL|nr:Origin recognition complex subunit 1 [Rhynchospora pubera]